MLNAECFPLPAEENSMFPRKAAAPQGVDADFPRLPLGVSLPAVDRRKGGAKPGVGCIHQHFCSAAGGVGLSPVVQFQQFYIKVCPQCPGSLTRWAISATGREKLAARKMGMVFDAKATSST